MAGAACTMRRQPDLRFERRLWRGGCTYVAGMDEAGRGALDVPIAVGVAVLRGVRDSKQMTPPEREEAAARIQSHALAWCVGFASAEEIDSCGIVVAGRLAAMRAVAGLG